MTASALHAVLLAAASALSPLGAARTPVSAAETVGRSAKGRPIDAVRVGSPAAKRTLLVVGAIHGNELAGRVVTRRLRRQTHGDFARGAMRRYRRSLGRLPAPASLR